MGKWGVDMGSELDRFTSSESSLTSTPSEAADLMELEAAEALAGLARSAATKESKGGKWGSKGKRAMKRVKSESSPDDSVSNSVPTRPDLSSLEDGGITVEDQQLGEDKPLNVRSMLIDSAKTEPEPELPKPSSRSNQTLGGGRSRQNLTEEEKEARRLRRILANRESARQTIRRRQALCVELTKRAADLAFENDNLRRERELALKEYRSLELANKNLKEQMAKVTKADREKSLSDLRPICGDKHGALLASCPAVIYDRHPFSPFGWPNIMQPSNAVQSLGSQGAVIIPSIIHMPPNGKLESSWHPQESSTNVNGTTTPFYVVPCPWFFPVSNHGNGFHSQPYFGINHMQESSPVSKCDGDTEALKVAASTEDLLPLEVKSETTSPSAVRLINDLNKVPVGFPSDEGSDELCITPLALSSVARTIAIENEMGSEPGSSAGTDCRSRVETKMPSDFPRRNCHPYESMKLVDAAAAAEARRKRKELTKLKNLHGCQCNVTARKGDAALLNGFRRSGQQTSVRKSNRFWQKQS